MIHAVTHAGHRKTANGTSADAAMSARIAAHIIHTVWDTEASQDKEIQIVH